MSPILIAHIVAGTLALVSGAVALWVRKGERAHRASGTVFFFSMLVLSALGAYLAISVPSRLSVVSGILTFYLVTTAWATARRKTEGVGALQYGALLVVLGCAAADATFGLQAAANPGGQLEGYPAMAYYIFAAVAALAAGLDLKVILRGGISGAPRIARHLWRMCLAAFVAAGSFFLGQQKVMPTFMQGSPLLFLPVIAPLILLAFWMIRVRLTNWNERSGAGALRVSTDRPVVP